MILSMVIGYVISYITLERQQQSPWNHISYHIDKQQKRAIKENRFMLFKFGLWDKASTDSKVTNANKDSNEDFKEGFCM